MEKTLQQLAERILTFDEASLRSLYGKYKAIFERFEPTREWEQSVVILFIINAVTTKNHLFNENILNRQKDGRKEPKPPEGESKGRPTLTRIK